MNLVRTADGRSGGGRGTCHQRDGYALDPSFPIRRPSSNSPSSSPTPHPSPTIPLIPIPYSDCKYPSYPLKFPQHRNQSLSELRPFSICTLPPHQRSPSPRNQQRAYRTLPHLPPCELRNTTMAHIGHLLRPPSRTRCDSMRPNPTNTLYHTYLNSTVPRVLRWGAGMSCQH